eukprot:4524165-Alexandrium_andersonii.AAC.1
MQKTVASTNSLSQSHTRACLACSGRPLLCMRSAADNHAACRAADSNLSCWSDGVRVHCDRC